MTGSSPNIKVLDGSSLNASIVTSSWHSDICDALVTGAKKRSLKPDVRMFLFTK